jgi:steroid 5-alpha reductase family enzyme
VTLALEGLAVVAASFAALWLVSLAKRDASIVDPFWGIGFVLVAWFWFVRGEAGTGRALAQAVAVTLWGARLSGYLLWRNAGAGEDFRYRAMRANAPDRFWWVSLFQVFLLQAVILWVVALPVLAVQRATGPATWSAWDVAGAIVFLTGLAFETVGDAQLVRFKADPANRGRVLDRGLWRYTRHPNYFGDALVWWGLFLPALAVPGAWWTALGPVLMTALLMKVSGVALLEKTLTETKPAYRDYVRRTSAFVPWPPGDA